MKPFEKKTSPRPKNPNSSSPQTSWEPVEKWYKKNVGNEGHYYHQHVVLPGALKLLNLADNTSSLLDLACGQGILARHLPKNIEYVGIDSAPSLIKEAKRIDQQRNHQYLVGDVLKQLPLQKNDFSHAAVILAIQNFEHPALALQNAAKHLMPGGKLLIVMNHPCFRMLRQSSWQVDEMQKIQYRRLDRYSSPMKFPIQANPSKGSDSPLTWSFHFPLAAYSSWLHQAGFAIELMEEWHSNKESTGKAAKMENRSREEFPLFLAILAVKNGIRDKYS